MSPRGFLWTINSYDGFDFLERFGFYNCKVDRLK